MAKAKLEAPFLNAAQLCSSFGACNGGTEAFKKLFPKGCFLTKANILKFITKYPDDIGEGWEDDLDYFVTNLRAQLENEDTGLYKRNRTRVLREKAIKRLRATYSAHAYENAIPEDYAADLARAVAGLRLAPAPRKK